MRIEAVVDEESITIHFVLEGGGHRVETVGYSLDELSTPLGNLWRTILGMGGDLPPHSYSLSLSPPHGYAPDEVARLYIDAVSSPDGVGSLLKSVFIPSPTDLGGLVEEKRYYFLHRNATLSLYGLVGRCTVIGYATPVLIAYPVKILEVRGRWVENIPHTLGGYPVVYTYNIYRGETQEEWITPLNEYILHLRGGAVITHANRGGEPPPPEPVHTVLQPQPIDGSHNPYGDPIPYLLRREMMRIDRGLVEALLSLKPSPTDPEEHMA